MVSDGAATKASELCTALPRLGRHLGRLRGRVADGALAVLEVVHRPGRGRDREDLEEADLLSVYDCTCLRAVLMRTPRRAARPVR